MIKSKLDQTKITRKKVIKNILDSAYASGKNSAHIGGALSIVDILVILFQKFIRLDKKNINSSARDYFILSKGHACLAYYSILNVKKFISQKDLKKFQSDDTFLYGHPVKNKKYGIDFSTGSLGMGASIGVGLALGQKKLKTKYKTYVILGDGECNEGSVWEAFMCSAHFKLDNLFFIIDKNNFQQTGKNKDIMNLGSLSKKLNAFGLNVETIDGHSFKQIENSILNVKKGKPKVIIANTIKGKYLDIAENNNVYHHTTLTKENYKKSLKNL